MYRLELETRLIRYPRLIGVGAIGLILLLLLGVLGRLWLTPLWRSYKMERDKVMQLQQRFAPLVDEFRQAKAQIQAVSLPVPQRCGSMVPLEHWVITLPQIFSWHTDAAGVEVVLHLTWPELLRFQQRLVVQAPLLLLQQMTIVTGPNSANELAAPLLILRLVFGHVSP